MWEGRARQAYWHVSALVQLWHIVSVQSPNRKPQAHLKAIVSYRITYRRLYCHSLGMGSVFGTFLVVADMAGPCDGSPPLVDLDCCSWWLHTCV